MTNDITETPPVVYYLGRRISRETGVKESICRHYIQVEFNIGGYERMNELTSRDTKEYSEIVDRISKKFSRNRTA